MSTILNQPLAVKTWLGRYITESEETGMVICNDCGTLVAASLATKHDALHNALDLMAKNPHTHQTSEISSLQSTIAELKQKIQILEGSQFKTKSGEVNDPATQNPFAAWETAKKKPSAKKKPPAKKTGDNILFAGNPVPKAQVQVAGVQHSSLGFLKAPPKTGVKGEWLVPELQAGGVLTHVYLELLDATGSKVVAKDKVQWKKLPAGVCPKVYGDWVKPTK